MSSRSDESDAALGSVHYSAGHDAFAAASSSRSDISDAATGSIHRSTSHTPSLVLEPSLEESDADDTPSGTVNSDALGGVHMTERRHPQSACLLMTGYASSLEGKRGILLIELSESCRPARATRCYAVPGGFLTPQEQQTVNLSDIASLAHTPTALLGAAREWQEEVHGLTGEAARAAGKHMIADAVTTGRITGPFGDVHTSGHAAYVIELAENDDLDSVHRSFVVNSEATSAIIVSVDKLRAGNATCTTSVQGSVILLREKIGHRRVVALRSLPQSATLAWWQTRAADMRVMTYADYTAELAVDAQNHEDHSYVEPKPSRSPHRKTVSFADDVTTIEFVVAAPTPPDNEALAADEVSKVAWDAERLSDAITDRWIRDSPAAVVLAQFQDPSVSWMQPMLNWIDTGCSNQVWKLGIDGLWYDDRADKHGHEALPLYLRLRATCWEWRTAVSHFNPRVAFLGRLEQYLIGKRAQHDIDVKRTVQCLEDTHNKADDGVWAPSATSIVNRAAAASASTPLAALGSRTSGHTVRYSDSAFLAHSLGHHLQIVNAATRKPVVNTTKRRVPSSPPPSVVRLRPDTTRCDREYQLPLPSDFEWPNISHFAFYEHVGNMRESWRALGYVSASVADRPTLIPPSPGCYHFVGQVYDFIRALPYPIFFQSSHVECGPASWSSHKTWPTKILDGRMLEAAEELLYIACVGKHSLAEQPHTAHEHTIGPPSQVINANEHGGANKTWCLWAREIGFIEPTQMVDPDQQHEALSAASGTSQEKMMLRSVTSRQMADAITASVNAQLPTWPNMDFTKAAWVPCPQYAAWRRALHHNFGVFASTYAPVLATSLLEDNERTAACAFILPIAPTVTGPAFLIPLQDGRVFGIALRDRPSHKVQVECACAFLSIGIESQYMHGMRNKQRDIVIAVPWDRHPVRVVTSPEELKRAQATKQPSAWCTVNALLGSPAHEPALLAVERCSAMGAPVWHDELNVGIWRRAKPTVMRQHARHYAMREQDPHAQAQWDAFLAEERRRKIVMVNDLLLADANADIVASICEDVRTAADYAAQLPVPPQGLPQYVEPSLLDVIAPERPMPLIRDWLHRLPPQALPPGFKPIPYTRALRQWARRMIASQYNTNMQFDAECYRHGHAPPGKRRASAFALGRGAACQIPHADGIGSYNPMDLLLERRADNPELFDAVDFTVPEKRKWVFDVIQRHIGSDGNNEMLSFLFHGVRWKIEAPRQLRFTRNLQRYDDRAQKIEVALRGLEKRGYVDVIPVCKVAAGITVDGPNPLLRMPQWECGIGGIDKSDGAVRIVGDCSDPHDHVRERNRHDGDADGPVVVSFNDLSGPKGKPTADYDGPMPFPEPEPKPRPRHKYTACAYLSYYAHVNESFVVSVDDDMRHCFFQFFVSEEDVGLIVWYLVVSIDGELWLVVIKVRTMNQGARNSSKIACNFTEEWLDAWRRAVDVYVAEWLTKQTPAMQRAYDYRLNKLGFAQARPFWGAVYTDNFDMTFCDSLLAAHAMRIWRTMNGEANIWLQDHVQYGTCTDWIGGRCAYGAGIGCVTPPKRARALVNCRRALAGTLTREEFESNNSFLGHVNDVCDWPASSLKGITGPLKSPGFDTDIVVMTPTASNKYQDIIALLEQRSFASFWSGVPDATGKWTGSGASLAPITVHASDACTDPEPTPDNPNPHPHVAGVANGLFWRYKLTGEWLDRHITLTESTGPAISSLMTIPLHPFDINVRASDATAAISAGTGTAHSGQLQAMMATLADEALYCEHIDSTWNNQWKGWGNGISDSLSRDNVPMARRIAASFNITLTELPITDTVKRFMWRTLVRTRVAPPDAFQICLRGIEGKSLFFYAWPTLTIEALLEAYKVEMLMSYDTSLRCIFNGKCALPTDTIAEVGVTKGDTAHVVPTIKGGVLHDVSDEVTPIRSPMFNRRRQSANSSKSDTEHVEAAAVADTTVVCPIRPPPRTRLSPPEREPETPSPAFRGSPRAATPRRARLVDAPTLSFEPELRQGSPQPTTAKAARTQISRAVAEQLSSVATEYAICPDDPDKLRRMVCDIGDVKTDTIKFGTAKADEWGFKKVMMFCQDMGPTVRWMRPRINSPLIDEVNEVWFTALALFWIAQCGMEPSARRKARGYNQAQPPSALLAIYAWRRVQRDCMRYLCDMAPVRAVLESLCLKYKQVWGPEAFEAQQAAVFADSMLRAIARALSEYGVPKWSIVLHDMWHVLHAYEIVTGTRCNEVVNAFEGDDYCKRSNLTLVDDSPVPKPVLMTPHNLQAMRNGTLLRGMTTASKMDRLNTTWGKQKQWFRYDDTEPLNFAWAWQQWELKYPCPLTERHIWPAFSPTGNERPLSPSVAASTHKALLNHAIGFAEALERFIHSYRATLASKLAEARARGAEIDDTTIQVALRWKTIASLLRYVKMTPKAYADMTDVALRTDAGQSVAPDLPEYEPTGTFDAVIASLEAMGVGPPAPSTTSAETAVAPHQRAPSTAPPAATTTFVHTATLDTIDVVGCATPVKDLGRDSWGLIGTTVTLPNQAWGDDLVGDTLCTIDYFIGKHKFSGSTATAYTVSYEGDSSNYAMRASFILRYLEPAKRRSLRKQQPEPRAVPG